MLDLILDKKFADSFHLAYIGNDEYVEDFRKYFIKNLKKFNLVSNYIDIEDIEKQLKSKDNPLLELIIERSPTLVFRPDLLSQIDSPEFPVSGSPFKVVLTGENTETCNSRRKRFGLEYLNPANLSERWKLYYSRRTDIVKITTNDSEIPDEHKFDSWDRFEPFIHPLNAIIIVDFYLLHWKREADFKVNLKNNIIPLMQNLITEASEEIPIEITFVSEFTDTPPIKQKERVSLTMLLIEKSIKSITTKSFSLNIVVHNKSNYPFPFQEFHDRKIITNYFYIDSGAGFSIDSAGYDIFNKSNKIRKIKKNTKVRFSTILNIQDYFSAFFDLKQLDIYCKKIKNYPERPDYINYHPNKTNRLLNISHS
ncbi:MAG: hypothetical protein ACOH2V_13565 [Candidatus Saccharimonadaceae bacterium]